MSREQEAISRLCLLVGICSVCAPKENEPVQKLIKECVEWLNTPAVQPGKCAECGQCEHTGTCAEASQVAQDAEKETK